jgi:hypothetical protein
MSQQKSGCGCLSVVVVVFILVWLVVFGGLAINFFNIGSKNFSTIDKVCNGEVQQDIVTFASKQTGEKGELIATTTDRKFAQIIGHPCNWKPNMESLRNIYFDATGTYGAIKEGQPSYVEYVPLEIYGQQAMVVSVVKSLTKSQAETLQEILNKDGKITPEQLAQVLAQ